MKVGDTLDPVALGLTAIDIKTFLKEEGYVVPQSSAADIYKLPAAVQARIEQVEEARKQYSSLEETIEFECPYCHDRNFANWRKNTTTNEEFVVCASCVKVKEVR